MQWLADLLALIRKAWDGWNERRRQAREKKRRDREREYRERYTRRGRR